jgi:hypothetical protein
VLNHLKFQILVEVNERTTSEFWLPDGSLLLLVAGTVVRLPVGAGFEPHQLRLLGTILLISVHRRFMGKTFKNKILMCCYFILLLSVSFKYDFLAKIETHKIGYIYVKYSTLLFFIAI